ncbi:hypothetical protein [Tunturiibacter gelidiferens]|uniref:hypothetical protein n=1 Tax=Tunturiibacter gelidiferens TaxID=3069689 RepID=UPI003D9B60AF
MDEAQYMHDPEYQKLCDIQNALDELGIQFTVISVGSHELTYQHEAFVRGGDIHLMGRFMVRDVQFHGIRSCEELEFVLNGYDRDSKWPTESGCSYTKFFFPRAFDAGFRFAHYGPTLWRIFEALAPPNPKRQLEVAMEHIGKTVEGLCRRSSDNEVKSLDFSRGDLEEEVARTAYRKYMRAVRMLAGSGRKD